MAWVDRGTVNVTNNSAVVTGVGTLWLSETTAGVGFAGPDGQLYEVLSIASNTSLTLTRPYRGPTATGQKYTLPPIQGHTKAAADRLSELISLLQNEYASVLKAADLQASPNDATNGKILTVGRSFGLGSSSAGSSYDKFPSASLNDDGVPSGLYWANNAVADLPPGFGSGLLIHRQIGTTGAQILINGSSGVMFYRGRVGSVWLAWKTSLSVSDFGLGSGTAAPPNGRDGVNPFGWYYKGNPAPSWGGGQFFLDMPYGHESQNAGLRLSTDPYTDNFYMNGGISGKKEYRPACKLVHDKNIVGDVGAGSVIATGSNANGTWTRFADGTQICFSPVVISNWVSTVSGNLWVSQDNTWTFPMAFLNADSYVITGSPQDSREAIWVTPGTARSAVNCAFKLVASFRWDVGLTARIIAVGRWKA